LTNEPPGIRTRAPSKKIHDSRFRMAAVTPSPTVKIERIMT
jgi:hypothetical protein